MNKLYPNAAAALDGLLQDGLLISCGGFGLCGIPERLLAAVEASGVKDLTFASNNAGIDNEGIGKLLRTPAGEEDDLQLCRREQGVRAAVSLGRAGSGILPARHAWPSGCAQAGAGIPGFYTRTGVGTLVAEGKEAKEFGGQEYILERGIFADLALVKAWKADTTGNVVFRKTARNFNVPAAQCGKVCVVEVEEVVEAGSFDPDCIHLPGVYVQRMIVGAPYDKKIEFRTTRTTDVG